MGYARVEEAVEAFDEAEDFDFDLIGAHDRAVNRSVQSGCVAAGGENADAFHGAHRSRSGLSLQFGMPIVGRVKICEKRFSDGVEPLLKHIAAFVEADV